MFDAKPEVSIDTAVKAIGGVSLFAILGKQILKIWKPTKSEEIDQATALIIELRRIITGQNADFVAMQKSHMQVIAAYEARISALHETLTRDWQSEQEHHIE